MATVTTASTTTRSAVRYAVRVTGAGHDLPLPAGVDAGVVGLAAGRHEPGDGWGLGNYRTLQHYQAGIWRYLANSSFVSRTDRRAARCPSRCSAATRSRGSASPAGTLLFLLTLAILMVPYATLLIPLYVLLNRLGLQNSLLGVALVLTMFQLPFSTFMMRISFESVPRELDEAAMVDGCSPFGVLWRVLLPGGEARADHGRPVRVPGGLERLPRAADPDQRHRQLTLPLAVSNLRGQVQGVVDYGATEAGVVVLALPCILLFLLLQRHYVRGFMSGALKG